MNYLPYLAFFSGLSIGMGAMYFIGLKMAEAAASLIVQEMIAKGKFKYLGVTYSCAPYPGIISDGK